MKLLRLIAYYRKRSESSGIAPQPAQEFNSLGNPSFQAINTTITNDLSADGFTWSQAPGIIIDQYDNVIVNAQKESPRRNVFIYNNGDQWVDNDAINDLSNIGELGTRWGLAYDSANDVLHGYLYFNNEVAVYRRYGIVRSGNDITDITWTRGVDPNIVTAETVTSYSHPIVLIHDSQLICIIGLSTVDSQIIALRAPLNITAVNQFTSIGFGNSGALVSILGTSYTNIATNTVNDADMNPTALILSDGTLFIAYCDNGVYKFKKFAYDGDNWSDDTAKNLYSVRITGTDSGYSLKSQLISKPVQIGSDVYLAIAIWKDNTLGDTVRLVKIASDNTVTSVDVYSANGAHTYAPTFDICTHEDKIIISYLKSGGNGTYARVYDGLTPLSDEVLAYDDNDSDIPLLADWQGELLMMFRIAGTPPQDGVYGTLTYESNV